MSQVCDDQAIVPARTEQWTAVFPEDDTWDGCSAHKLESARAFALAMMGGIHGDIERARDYGSLIACIRAEGLFHHINWNGNAEPVWSKHFAFVYDHCDFSAKFRCSVAAIMKVPVLAHSLHILRKSVFKRHAIVELVCSSGRVHMEVKKMSFFANEDGFFVHHGLLLFGSKHGEVYIDVHPSNDANFAVDRELPSYQRYCEREAPERTLTDAERAAQIAHEARLLAFVTRRPSIDSDGFVTRVFFECFDGFQPDAGVFLHVRVENTHQVENGEKWSALLLDLLMAGNQFSYSTPQTEKLVCDGAIVPSNAEPCDHQLKDVHTIFRVPGTLFVDATLTTPMSLRRSGRSKMAFRGKKRKGPGAIAFDSTRRSAPDREHDLKWVVDKRGVVKRAGRASLDSKPYRRSVSL